MDIAVNPGDSAALAAPAIGGGPAKMGPASTLPDTCWKLVTAQVRVSLSPTELHCGEPRRVAAQRAFASLLMRFHPKLDGVVVGQRGGLRFGTRPLAPSNPASPFAHVVASATLLVFAPPVGVCLNAPVTHVGPDHVGLGLWNTFHVVLAMSDVDGAYKFDSAKRQWLYVGEGTAPVISVGSIVRFSVVGLKHTEAGIFHVAASLRGSDGKLNPVLGVQKKRPPKPAVGTPTAGVALENRPSRTAFQAHVNGGGAGSGASSSDDDSDGGGDENDGNEVGNQFPDPSSLGTPMKVSMNNLGCDDVFDDALGGGGNDSTDNADTKKPISPGPTSQSAPNQSVLPSAKHLEPQPSSKVTDMKIKGGLVSPAKVGDDVASGAASSKKKSKKKSGNAHRKEKAGPVGSPPVESKGGSENGGAPVGHANPKKRKRSSVLSTNAEKMEDGAVDGENPALVTKSGKKEKKRRRKEKREDDVVPPLKPEESKDEFSVGMDLVHPASGKTPVESKIEEKKKQHDRMVVKPEDDKLVVKPEDVIGHKSASKPPSKSAQKTPGKHRRIKNIEKLGRRLSAQFRSGE